MINKTINLDEYFKGMSEEEIQKKFDELEILWKENQTKKLESMTSVEQKEYFTNMIRQGKPYIRKVNKIGRNDICFCGSNKKYKNCCMDQFEDYIEHSEYYKLLSDHVDELKNNKDERIE